MRVTIEDEVTSTNDLLYFSALKEERKEDEALISLAQTGGKGRRGRSFFSPKGSGLYLSLLLHPKATVAEATKITTIMAVAASRALEKHDSPKVMIKWVNDLYVRDRKVGGILTTCSPSIEEGIPSFVVCGIGINIYEPAGGFPEEIASRAGSVFEGNALSKNNPENVFEFEKGAKCEHSELGSFKDLRLEIAKSIIDEFVSLYQRINDNPHLEEYRERSFLIGREVTILGDETPKVRVLGVEDDLSLRVGYEDGREECLSAGEVSLVL